MTRPQQHLYLCACQASGLTHTHCTMQSHNILMVQQMLHHAATRTALTLSWSACTLTALCHYHMLCHAATHPTLTCHGQYAVPQHRYSQHALHYAATHNTLTWHGQYAVPQHRCSQHVLHDAATPQQHHSKTTARSRRETTDVTCQGCRYFLGQPVIIIIIIVITTLSSS